jgi:N-methylhydantoinase B
VALRAGDVLRVERAGGGGYGAPRERAPEAVLRDVQNGYVSPEEARAVYGVVLVRQSRAWTVDAAATAALRAAPDP